MQKHVTRALFLSRRQMSLLKAGLLASVLLVLCSYASAERRVAVLGDYEVFDAHLRGEDGVKHSFRALRTLSNSSTVIDDEYSGSGGNLLGGIFTAGPASGDSVFGTFHMHEVRRL